MNNMHNIKLTIAYDGTNYHGFQRQNNALTIQEVIEEKLSPIMGHQIKLTIAARTDSGVHAHGQVVNFYTTGTIPADRIPRAAMSLLPADIVILKGEEVPKIFHARFHAQKKLYTYRILNAPVLDPFERKYAWHQYGKLDIDAMGEGLELFKGTHDFSAFRATGGAQVNPVRTILETTLEPKNDIIEISFLGTGFLYHQVRNMVGTLVEIGHKRRNPENISDLLQNKERSKAGPTAPALGLHLKEIWY